MRLCPPAERRHRGRRRHPLFVRGGSLPHPWRPTGVDRWLLRASGAAYARVGTRGRRWRPHRTCITANTLPRMPRVARAAGAARDGPSRTSARAVWSVLGLVVAGLAGCTFADPPTAGESFATPSPPSAAHSDASREPRPRSVVVTFHDETGTGYDFTPDQEALVRQVAQRST
jgi:hypothetical protein